MEQSTIWTPTKPIIETLGFDIGTTCAYRCII